MFSAPVFEGNAEQEPFYFLFIPSPGHGGGFGGKGARLRAGA
jgi:hypothetical protein